MYCAGAARPAALRRVLDRALEDRDTPLARRAIEALAQSAGESGLRAVASDERPLIVALNYPERRVQYEAALALASYALASVSSELGLEFYRAIPGIGWFRSPRRILFLTNFAVAVLAGIGLDALRLRVPSDSTRVRKTCPER